MKDNKKNILQVFASNSWGGGELFVYDLTKRLIEDKNNIVCVSKKSPIIEDKLKEINVDYYTLKMNGVLDFISAFKLKKIILKHNIDIIHVHNFKSAFTAVYVKLLLKKSIKLILTRHLVKKAKTSFLYSWLYKHIDNIAFVSKLALDEFLSSNPIIDKTKCSVIYNSIQPLISKDKVINLRQNLNIEDHTTLLLFTGRLDKEKGIDILIEAMAELKDRDIALVVAGSGKEDYELKLKDKVKKFGLEDRIYFIGFISNISNIIDQADFGVCPSIGRESFGLSIIEFMQEGKAVITTNNGAQPEYIKDKETGVLVNPNNHKELVQAIDLLITNNDLRKRIGNNAKEYFQKELSYQKFYEKINKLYF